jgi:hypothetical protein
MIATKKKRGPEPALSTTKLPQTSHVLPFLQFQSWWCEAERLAVLFRRTHAKRHLVTPARHMDAAYTRLTERSSAQ